MSIPSYQFASLNMENNAKKRVMKRAKKGFETEEQRSIKSGKIVDSIKNVYKSIISNLEMQKTTIIIARAFVDSIASSEIGEEEYDYSDDDPKNPEYLQPIDEASEVSVVAVKEKSLISYLIASLGKLVSLANELVNLIKALREEVQATGKPASPSIDIAKIVKLMQDVDNLYGNWDGDTGLAHSMHVMVDSLFKQGSYPPQIDGLLGLWEGNNSKARELLEEIQTNQYKTEYKSVNIPSKSKEPRRQRDIASGREQRDYTGAEYKLMVELRRKGLLSGDDFTSVFSGYDDDELSLSSSDEGDSDDDSSSDGDAGNAYAMFPDIGQYALFPDAGDY